MPSSPPIRSTHRAVLLGAASLAAIGLLLSLGGCYQRVVRAKGLGADNYNVSEPYQESGQLDEWIFGSPGPHERQRGNTKLPQ